MFIALLAAIAIAQASAATPFGSDFHTKAISESLLSEIKTKATTWKAAVPEKFHNATVADVKKLLGTIMPHETGYSAPEVEKTVFSISDEDIPENFDLRTAYPNCANIVGRVRDQSNCGSCWAFGSTEAFNDRYCIATGDNKTVFSVTDTLSCCSGLSCKFSMGCNGGQPSGAWDFFVKTGVVTGGDYADVGTGSTCLPYTFQSCAHHVEPSNGLPACEDIDSYKTPKCASTCSENAYTNPWSKDKYFAKSSYKVKSEINMQKELMEKGTLSVALSVYEDFEAYSTGVYQHVSGKYLGGHAVKMIGWGVENGVKYWTCVNSWNDTWGEKGIFRILRGVDECGIESSVVAGDA